MVFGPASSIIAAVKFYNGYAAKFVQNSRAGIRRGHRHLLLGLFPIEAEVTDMRNQKRKQYHEMNKDVCDRGRDLDRNDNKHKERVSHVSSFQEKRTNTATVHC